MRVLVEVLVRDSEKQVLVDKFWEAPGVPKQNMFW
jgi:hypothetical protein